jgi:hypothetical protein
MVQGRSRAGAMRGEKSRQWEKWLVVMVAVGHHGNGGDDVGEREREIEMGSLRPPVLFSRCT